MKKLDMQNSVFWLMKPKIQQINKRCQLFYDLLIVLVSCESLFFEIVHVINTTTAMLKEKISSVLDIICIALICGVRGMTALAICQVLGKDFRSIS